MAYQAKQMTDQERLQSKAHTARMALQDFWAELLRQRGGLIPQHQFNTTLRFFQIVTAALAKVEREGQE